MFGGRRRPLNPLFRGLGCCALVIAVLGLWFGIGAVQLQAAVPQAASVSHAVVVAVQNARPLPPDGVAVPVETMFVVGVLCLVLTASRRKPVLACSCAGRPLNRAPPP